MTFDVLDSKNAPEPCHDTDPERENEKTPEIPKSDGTAGASVSIRAIDTPPIPSMPGALNDAAKAYLKERAVSETVALAAGLYSADAEYMKKLLAMREAPHCGGIVIPYPYRGAQLPYYRVRYDRPTDEGQRFGVPAGQPVPIYIASASVLEPEAPLFVVEGPIKALALAELGYAAVGLGGITTTLKTVKSGGHVLGESWGAVPLLRRDVYIAFDAGCATNPEVAQAEANLGRVLEAAGARVKVVRIPLRGSFVVRERAEVAS